MTLTIKPIYSRFAAKIHVVTKKWPLWQENQTNPLIVQHYLDGEKFCSYSICHQGTIVAHSVYKPLHSMGIGSAFCFEATQSAAIDAFTNQVVKALDFTGQIAFDFIQTDQLYCIECNPRATSGVHLFEKNPALVEAFLGKNLYVTPREGTLCHDHIFMLWFGIKQKEIFSKRFWRHFFIGKNPLWTRKDLRIITALPFVFWDLISLTLLRRQGFHQAMSLDLEYNG